MIVNPDYAHKEYPSNYHWLIGEVLDRANQWLNEFGEKQYFESDSSYTETIPSIIGYCLDELYEGYQNGKLGIGFINRQLYYHCLSAYFSARTNDIIRASIEEEIILKIPKHLIVPALEFALDEKFALDIQQMLKGGLRTINPHEKVVLNPLSDFLLQHDFL